MPAIGPVTREVGDDDLVSHHEIGALGRVQRAQETGQRGVLVGCIVSVSERGIEIPKLLDSHWVTLLSERLSDQFSRLACTAPLAGPYPGRQESGNDHGSADGTRLFSPSLVEVALGAAVADVELRWISHARRKRMPEHEHQTRPMIDGCCVRSTCRVGRWSGAGLLCHGTGCQNGDQADHDDKPECRPVLVHS